MSRKLAVCAVSAAVIGALTFVCRVITTVRAYPPAIWGRATVRLLMYYESDIGLPIWAFTAAAAILQIVFVFIVTAVVLIISANRKSFLQTMFLGLLIFAVPLTLGVMGFEPAKWVSVFPPYAITRLILTNPDGYGLPLFGRA